MRDSRFFKPLSLILASLLMAVQIQPVYAGLVGSEEILQQAGAELDRQRLGELVQREEVRAQFAQLGVDTAELDARIARLTDQEVAELNQKLEQLPAGGVDALGAVLFIFVIFVITDVIGATDIFPFIKSVEK